MPKLKVQELIDALTALNRPHDDVAIRCHDVQSFTTLIAVDVVELVHHGVYPINYPDEGEMVAPKYDSGCEISHVVLWPKGDSVEPPDDEAYARSAKGLTTE